MLMGLAFVLLQYMISAKAGLVNYVDGQSNVQLHQQVIEGATVETGIQGHVELLLTPGAFLRIGNDSKVIFDSVELNRVAIRLVSGSALVEVSDIDKHVPLRVTAGDLHAVIVSRGIYRFSPGTASVVDGKIRIADTHKSASKGHQITTTANGYTASTFTMPANDDLDDWSRSRSAVLANANAIAYKDSTVGTYSQVNYPYGDIYSNRSSWLYSSLLGGFTFVPRIGYRSYYGYTFVPVSAFAGLPAFTGRPFGVPTRPVHSGGTTSRPRPVGGAVGGVRGPVGGHGLGGRAGGHGGHR
jgi:FecR protein